MKKACFWLTLALEAAALLLGAAAVAVLLYLAPEGPSLLACALATPLLMGGCGGFYLGGKTSPRWVRAACAAAGTGLALIAALLASLEPRLLTAGTLLRAAGLLLAAALPGALLGAGRTEARRSAKKQGEAPAGTA